VREEPAEENRRVNPREVHDQQTEQSQVKSAQQQQPNSVMEALAGLKKKSQPPAF